VDINNYEVCKLNVTSEHRECLTLYDLLTLVIPYQSGDDILVTQRNKLVDLNLKTKKWDVIGVAAEEMEGKERFNDGKVDAKGRFWGGTLTQASIDPRSQVLIGKGNLYKFENGKFIKMADGFTLTNGMTWSHDNKKMYVNDSDGRKIYVFDFDLEKGTLSNKKVLVDCDKSSDFHPKEYPDGLTIDQQGMLWSALYNGSGVVKVNPVTGKVEDRVFIPSPLTTSVSFGGPNFDHLFVTTAYSNFGPDLRKKWKDAGKVFQITADIKSFKGSAGNRYLPPKM